MSTPAYLVIPALLPMITRWLHTPEVVQWWGEPEEQLAQVSEDLDEPLMPSEGPAVVMLFERRAAGRASRGSRRLPDPPAQQAR